MLHFLTAVVVSHLTCYQCPSQNRDCIIVTLKCHSNYKMWTTFTSKVATINISCLWKRWLYILYHGYLQCVFMKYLHSATKSRRATLDFSCNLFLTNTSWLNRFWYNLYLSVSPPQGSTCDIRVKNGSMFEGIFKTLSSRVRITYWACRHCLPLKIQMMHHK